MMSFDQIRLGSQKPDKRFIGRLLALDPGETTGVVGIEANEDAINPFHQDQVKTWPITSGIDNITGLLDLIQPKAVVFERYAVYEWKTDQHSWSEIPTLQLIGAIKTLCYLRQIPIYQQTAQVAKQFVTDEKLEQWGLYKKGQKHSRDAMRHACYYLLFGKHDQNFAS